MKKRASRRRFLGVVAAGTAAALIAPTQALAQAAAESARRKTVAPAKRPAPGRRVASPAEIEKLEGFTAAALEAIRAFPLPAGSPPAFVFRPLPAKRGKAK